jgi:hypothetical protein
LRATSNVRSLSFAISRVEFDASASTHPSAASCSRCGISAAMVPSPFGRTTRVGCSRTNSTTAAAKAAALAA